MGSMVFLTNVSLEIYTLPPLSSKILFTNLLACKLSGYTSLAISLYEYPCLRISRILPLLTKSGNLSPDMGFKYNPRFSLYAFSIFSFGVTYLRLVI